MSGALITTTPPWLTDMSAASAARSRGRSATLYPTERNRPRTALSASCHDSVKHNMSIRRSRQSSVISSNLFSSDRTFRQPQTIGDSVARLPAGQCEQLIDVEDSCVIVAPRNPSRDGVENVLM